MAGKKFRKRGVDVDSEWDALDVVALPDVEDARGTRPSYSTQHIKEVVAGASFRREPILLEHERQRSGVPIGAGCR